jgi:predicted transcriptional regulator
MSHEEIAIGLGITRPTLSKHYARELTEGAYQRRLEVYQAMHKAAMKGNVSAQKAYAAMVPALEAPPLEDDKAPPLGKKEQANEDAKTAAHGTDWEDLLPRGVTPIRKAS